MSMPPWGEEPSADATPPPPPPPPSNPYGQQQAMPYQPYGGAPSPYTPFQATPQTNGLAIGSLIVSIASIVLCCGFPGIVGAILGHIARRQIKEDPNQTGEGLALGGIIVGWVAFVLSLVGVVLWILIVAVGVFAGSSVDDCSTDSDGYYVCD
ncbi:DUF4190 domain-containing protein [Nocardioides humilatus]|uniref:DUF4190 domain-containing protein n=1 Tax=Nocardioides humilatus TaxID=2607660 RepID=A0A5B1L594_9ACTN|nr:DUF4190 domain-containing protein [Nocardioides humilatus]KAA1415823.1 DUF4190 domain-containing protein [Nocardioides humilatus]